MVSVNYCKHGVFCIHSKCRFNQSHLKGIENNSSLKEKMKELVEIWKNRHVRSE
jgi:hypothetical protein